MKFTIITPAFNSASSITNTVESVLSQSFEDYEHLIIDGGSTDGTLDRLKSYSHLRVVSEDDKGVYDAMNKGIRISKGEWIYFLGSDDVLHDNEVLKDIAQTLTNPNELLVYGYVILKATGAAYDGEFTIAKLAGRNISHQSIFYNKDIFSQLGLFNHNHSFLADYDFNIRAFALFENRIRYIDRVIAIYNESGISRTNFDRSFWSSRESQNLKFLFPKVSRKEIYQGMEPYFYYLVENRLIVRNLGFICRFLLFSRNLNYLVDILYLNSRKRH